MQRGSLKIKQSGLVQMAYNLLIHPLRLFPGPWYCKASRLWYFVQVARGKLNYEVRRLHDVYGDTVCIAPNELSYNGADVWSPIYGRESEPCDYRSLSDM